MASIPTKGIKHVANTEYLQQNIQQVFRQPSPQFHLISDLGEKKGLLGVLAVTAGSEASRGHGESGLTFKMSSLPLISRGQHPSKLRFPSSQHHQELWLSFTLWKTVSKYIWRLDSTSTAAAPPPNVSPSPPLTHIYKQHILGTQASLGRHFCSSPGSEITTLSHLWAKISSTQQGGGGGMSPASPQFRCSWA